MLVDQRTGQVLDIIKQNEEGKLVVAKEACEQGRVEVNGKVAKPGLELKTGDEIQITFGSNILRVRVVSMPDNVRKDDAQSMYEVLG